MSGAGVEIQDVSKSFDDVFAVDGVSFHIPRGETMGLIGPNGAGKTTLLRMMATLSKPDRGDIRIFGISVRRQPAVARKILGFMPAEFGTPQNITIGEYLAYFACLHAVPMAERAQRLRDVCELTDLAGRETVMVKDLSTGNRQRLLLAKTLLDDPRLLVLDEPASGLDPRARTELRAILRTLAALGKTTIVSSHILPDIEEICDRVGILEAGRLVLDGRLQDLKTQQANGRRTLNVRVPADDWSRASDLIGRLPRVVACQTCEQFLVVDTEGPNCNFILRELLEHDIRILHFAERETPLEEIFMRSTKGRVT